MDVRPDIELWSLESEISRWHELQKELPEDEVLDTAIWEMVLEEDWLAKQEHEKNMKKLQEMEIQFKIQK